MLSSTGLALATLSGFGLVLEHVRESLPPTSLPAVSVLARPSPAVLSSMSLCPSGGGGVHILSVARSCIYMFSAGCKRENLNSIFHLLVAQSRCLISPFIIMAG